MKNRCAVCQCFLQTKRFVTIESHLFRTIFQFRNAHFGMFFLQKQLKSSQSPHQDTRNAIRRCGLREEFLLYCQICLRNIRRGPEIFPKSALNPLDSPHRSLFCAQIFPKSAPSTTSLPNLRTIKHKILLFVAKLLTTVEHSSRSPHLSSQTA